MKREEMSAVFVDALTRLRPGGYVWLITHAWNGLLQDDCLLDEEALTSARWHAKWLKSIKPDVAAAGT